MTSTPGRFFVIEGTDATGKTTLGELLGAGKLTTSVECPLEPLSDIKGRVFSGLDPLARLLYFASGNAQLSSLAGRVDAGRVLVGIRYIWSTLAYHSAIEGTKVSATLDLLESVTPHLVMPERVIFLTARESEKRRRLEQRGETSEESPEKIAEFEARLSECYREAFNLIPAPMMYVDTSTTTADGLAESLRTTLHAC